MRIYGGGFREILDQKYTKNCEGIMVKNGNNMNEGYMRE
jgi:hypothetical protein